MMYDPSALSPLTPSTHPNPLPRTDATCKDAQDAFSRLAENNSELLMKTLCLGLQQSVQH